MCKQFYKVVIEDIENENCSKKEEGALIDIFVYTIRRTSSSLARKAWFKLKDFRSAKAKNIEGFDLTLERKTINSQNQWYGCFTSDTKKIKFMATLEDV